MPALANEDPLAAAQDAGSSLRAHADSSDLDGRLAKETLDLLREAGFLRLYAPRSLGGVETDPVTHARVQEELSRHDPAAGWLLQVASSGAWWCSRLPTQGVEDIYRDGPDQVIAASFGTPVTASPVEGGFRISGRGGFASNVTSARWVLLLAVTIEDGEPQSVAGTPIVRAVFVPTSDVTVIESWDSLGMRATESHDVSVEDAYVPEHRTFRVGIDHTPGEGFDGPLYRMPAMVLVASIGPAVAMGAAREAIDEVVSLAPGKTPFSSTALLRERATAQSHVGRAEGALRAARTHVYDRIRWAWEATVAGEDLTLEQRADVLLAAVQALDASVTAVDLMFATAGSSAVYKRSRVERLFRDVQTLRQHGFMNRSRFETVGQVFMGLDPDLGFVPL